MPNFSFFIFFLKKKYFTEAFSAEACHTQREGKAFAAAIKPAAPKILLKKKKYRAGAVVLRARKKEREGQFLVFTEEAPFFFTFFHFLLLFWFLKTKKVKATLPPPPSPTLNNLLEIDGVGVGGGGLDGVEKNPTLSPIYIEYI